MTQQRKWKIGRSSTNKDFISPKKESGFVFLLGVLKRRTPGAEKGVSILNRGGNLTLRPISGWGRKEKATEKLSMMKASSPPRQDDTVGKNC